MYEKIGELNNDMVTLTFYKMDDGVAEIEMNVGMYSKMTMKVEQKDVLALAFKLMGECDDE